MAHEFVDPDVERLPLSEGRWIDVKKELTAGDTRRVFARMAKASTDDNGKVKTEIDLEKVGLTKLTEYIVGWSFSNGDGKPVPVSEAAINNLRQSIYREIVAAVDAHEERLEQQLAAAKAADPTGASGSSTT